MATMTSFEDDLAKFEKPSTDPVSSVRHLTSMVGHYAEAEHCRLDISVSNQSVTLSVDNKLETLELTHESFTVQRASRPDVFHFIENNAAMQPRCEKSIFQEFRNLPFCQSLFAWAVPSRLSTAANGTWGTLIVGHSRAGHFTMERVENICRILDAFKRNSRRLMFLTDLVDTIYNLQHIHEAIPFVDIISRFLKDHGAFQSVSVSLLNADKDRAVMFADREDHREVKGLQVSPQMLLSQNMANDTDAPIEVTSSMTQAPEEQVPSDVGMLLPVNPLHSSCLLAMSLRKPKTTSSGPPMMLTLSCMPDDSSPRNLFLGMLYFKVHNRVRRVLAQLIMRLAPLFANVLSQNVNITKDIEHNILIHPQENGLGLSQEKREFLEKHKNIGRTFQEARRREWKSEEPSLYGLTLTSVISQRPSAAILKGSSAGQQVAVKLMSTGGNYGPNRAQRELTISRSVDHKNIAKTLDHKINVSDRQILKCCRCTCPMTASCPYHEIQRVLMSIVASKHVHQSRWDLLISDYYPETLSTLIHQQRLFALPSDHPQTGCGVIDWKLGTNWNADGTLAVMLEVVEGLRYLHSMGIVFGDLNPENVLMQTVSSPSGAVRRIVKLGDFGSSCVEGFDRVRSNCTLAYNPPEGFKPQLGSRKHSEGCAGDIYAVGVVLWEMLMAKRPFSMFVGNSMGLHQWVEGSGRCEFCEGFPHELRYLINRCWHQNPKERPTVGVIVEELKAMVGSIK